MRRILILSVVGAVALGVLLVGCTGGGAAPAKPKAEAPAPAGPVEIRSEAAAKRPHPSDPADEAAPAAVAEADSLAKVVARERELALAEQAKSASAKEGKVLWSKPVEGAAAGTKSADVSAMAVAGTKAKAVAPSVEAVEIPGLSEPTAIADPDPAAPAAPAEAAAPAAPAEAAAPAAPAEAAAPAASAEAAAPATPATDTDAIREISGAEKLAAEAGKVQSVARFQSGLNFYNTQLYEEALAAFEEALATDPGHKEARVYRDRCRQLLGKPGPEGADVMIAEIAGRAKAELASVEMRMKADVEQAEQLYLAATTPGEARKLLERPDQIAESLGDLDRATERVQHLESLFGTSPLAAGSEQALKLRSAALRAQIGQAKKTLLAERETLDRDAAKIAAEQRGQDVRSIEKQRLEKLMTSAKFYFDRKDFARARDLCEKILREDPTNADALALRGQARAEAHKKADFDNATQLHDAEVLWQQEGSKLAIQPSSDLQYPEDWEQIKRRVSRQRDASAGSELERMIRDRLDSTRLTVEYTENPLGDVLREVSERGRVNIVIDQAGEVDAQTPVTLAVTDMTLGKILDWIMELTGYRYEIRSEAVFISKQAQKNLLLQLYPVYDLTRGYRNFYPLAREGETGSSTSTSTDETDAAGSGSVTDLKERISKFVAPESWEEAGVTVELWEDNLLIVQRPDVHAQIVSFLNRLRESSKQQVLVEGRFIEVQESFLEEIGVTWQNYNPTGAPASLGVPGTRPNEGLYSFRGTDGYQAAPQNTNPSTMPDGSLMQSGSLYEHGGRWVSETLTTDRRGGTAASSVNSANKGLNLSMGYLSQNALNTFQIYSLLHALNEKRQGSVLHNPRLLVANGNNAYLQIFTITNYVRTYTQQGDIFQPEVRQYEQGVEWNVRPVISFDRKYITIRLRPRLVAYDAVNSWQWSMRRTTVIGGTTGGRILSAIDLPMTLPSIVTTQLESSVTIPDGGTVLVGGLIQDNREEGVSGVPFLSSIPVIGRALRNEKRSHEKRNLIIMVQGKIVELDS